MNSPDIILLVVSQSARQATRTWNALGSQLTETDQLFNTDTFRYDRLGHRTAEIDALSNSHYNFYDTVGNLIQEVDSAE